MMDSERPGKRTEWNAPWPKTAWSLIDRARKESKAALQDMLSLYSRPITTYVTKKIGSVDEADDVVQEILADLATKNILSKVESSKGRFRCLLIAITRNKVLKFFRDRPRREASLDVSWGDEGASLKDVLEDGSVVRDEEFDAAWAVGIVGRALERMRQLKVPEVGALYLCAYRGLSMKEAAEALESTQANVRNHLHRGRRKLVENILEIQAEESPGRADFVEEVLYLRQFFPDDVKTTLTRERAEEVWDSAAR